MSNAEKLKALKLTIDKIDKDFGKGSVMMMNEKSTEPMEVVSTGSIGLDVALGIGGLPRGRVIEIFGPESSGKTTITLQIIAEAQKAGGMAAPLMDRLALNPARVEAIEPAGSGDFTVTLAGGLKAPLSRRFRDALEALYALKAKLPKQ